VYAAGYIYGTGTYNFGGQTVAGTYTGSNIVLVKYNSNGVAQWAQTVAAGSNVSSFSSVSVASDGSVYAAGNIYGTGTYNFGNGVTAAGPTNGYNLVLVKYNSSGVAQWAQTVTAGNNESSFNSVSVASDGLSVYAAGYIAGTGTFNFGNSVISAGTYTDGGSVALVKYNSSGVAQWAQTVTAGTGDSFFTSVSAVASDGSVYAAGYIQGATPYNFSPSVTATGTSSGGINMVLVKYNSTGVAQWAQTVTAGSTSSENLFGVSAASDGSVYAVGYIDGSGTFNFGNSVTAIGAYAGENVVLVKYDSTGVASWAQTVTAANNASFFAGVSVASSGYVYAAGDIAGSGTFNFGNGATATVTNGVGNCILVGY
jgi:outer membrane protein assembly factor BamB